jgi:hypothetical protein
MMTMLAVPRPALAMFTRTHATLSGVIWKFSISFIWNFSNLLKDLLNEIECRLAIDLSRSSAPN